MKIFRLQIFLYTTSAKANMCIKFDSRSPFRFRKILHKSEKNNSHCFAPCKFTAGVEGCIDFKRFLKKSKLFAWQIRSRYVRTIRSDFFTASHFSSTIHFIFKAI